MAIFCTKCGAQLSEGMAFCAKCGARVEATAAPAPAVVPSPPTPPPSTAPARSASPSPPAAPMNVSMAAPPSPPKKSSNLVLKIVLGVLALFALISVLAIGSCIYIGYRIKKKADQIQEAYKKANVGKVLGALGQAGSQGAGQGPGQGTGQAQPGSAPDIGKILGALSQAASQAGAQGAGQGQGQPGGQPNIGQILGALGQAMKQGAGGETRPAGTCPSADQAAFDNYLKNAAASSIPLKPGTTLTNIWSPRAGEPDIDVLTTVKSIQSGTIETTGMALDGKNISNTRNLCVGDLLTAREYETAIGTSSPETIPGATMFSVSQAVFSDIKGGKPAALTYYEAQKIPTGGYTLGTVSKGTLSRVESSDVPYSIIVNGAQKNLPAIHAKGVLGGMPLELWVLDDAADPIVLNFKGFGGRFHITYVKITFPVKKQVEQQLAKTGRAEIYGIYFDFNKATPRPESAPVLKEIAQALTDNPAWKLKIEGHTDNIGGDAYNLKLSQQRAEGVMQALVTEYGISAGRLSAQGYGATRPKATNDTVEGRALNRRVELVRE